MNMIKRIISTVISATLIGSCMIAFPVYAEEAESPIVYRTSCEGSSENGYCNFIYTLKARENGNIHIEVQGKDYNDYAGLRVDTIGKLMFNDTKIAPIGETGSAGVSSVKLYNVKSSGSVSYRCEEIESYADDNIVYTLSFTKDCSYVINQVIVAYDLYVKKPYLNTNIDINLFGTDITIPYGDLSTNPIINTNNDEAIEALGNRIKELEASIVEKDEMINTINIESENYKELYYNACALNNELIIENKNLSADNANLEVDVVNSNNTINLLSDENEQLKNEIKMWVDKIAKMSQSAEAVNTMSDSINRCDINGDYMIDAVDASIILSAYARISTGENIQHISQVVNY